MPSRKQLALQDGRTLSVARHLARLSQDELARRVGISRAAISRYEAGKRRMGAETRLRILAALAGGPDAAA